jgi:ATP-binding cassette subfamily B protein
MSRRRRLVPEVMQASAMDCGPAVLKSLLEGHGVPVRYEPLREACQTDVDGTAIETLEALLPHLGLAAEQVLVPVEHVLLPEARTLPAIAVVDRPGGFVHFVVVWRRHGPWVQVMDPGAGRTWRRAGAWESELHRHTQEVPAADWREWAGGDEFTNALAARLRDLGYSATAARAEVDAACGDASWRGLAGLDAAVRYAALAEARGAVARGGEARRLVAWLAGRVASGERTAVPDACWSVQPLDDGFLAYRGAVLVRVTGRVEASAADRGEDDAVAHVAQRADLRGSDPPFFRQVLRLLRSGGRALTVAASAAALAGAGGVALEALAWNALVQAGSWPLAPVDGLRAFAGLVLLALALVALDVLAAGAARAAGRRFETRLRSAFLRAAPRLGERLVSTRLRGDLVERSHSAFALRELPAHAALTLSRGVELAATLAAVAWFFPASAVPAALLVALAFAVPALAQPLLAERDLRLRTHAGGLARICLDALLGSVPVRAHGGEAAVRREHDERLGGWRDAGRSFLGAAVAVEVVRGLPAAALTAWMLWAQVRHGVSGGVLLLAWWALRLPELGAGLAVALKQWPRQRSLLRRLLEPIEGADEESAGVPGAEPDAAVPAPTGAALRMEGVTVALGGRVVLADIDLALEPGEHVAVLGESGAGKSTLLAAVLGFHRPSGGRITVAGDVPDAAGLARLRSACAWVDPTVHLWRDTLHANLRYGAPDSPRPLPPALAVAGLERLIETLPSGLETELGEGGGLVSGGEGQRVRFARALLRPGVRLALLDEPFRGLDRAERDRLMGVAREAWSDATLLAVTHDVLPTTAFDRVVVLSDGRLVESGRPRDLLARTDSRYAALLRAERAVLEGGWGDARWRRLRVDGAKVEERTASAVEAAP